MKRRSKLLVVALALLSAGCKPTTIIAGQQQEHPMGGKPAMLPPAVKESHTYRCADNTVVYVDYLADDATANLRSGEQGPNVQLKGTRVSFAGSGYTLMRAGEAITLRRPGHDLQRCIP